MIYYSVNKATNDSMMQTRKKCKIQAWFYDCMIQARFYECMIQERNECMIQVGW